SLPRPRGQVYLTLASDPAAIGDLDKARRVPLVFSVTLIGPLTDAAETVAIIQECRSTLTETPALTANVGYRGEDCPKSRRLPFPGHLVENATCWPRTAGDRGELERKFPGWFTRCYAVLLPTLTS